MKPKAYHYSAHQRNENVKNVWWRTKYLQCLEGWWSRDILKWKYSTCLPPENWDCQSSDLIIMGSKIFLISLGIYKFRNNNKQKLGVIKLKQQNYFSCWFLIFVLLHKCKIPNWQISWVGQSANLEMGIKASRKNYQQSASASVSANQHQQSAMS